MLDLIGCKEPITSTSAERSLRITQRIGLNGAGIKQGQRVSFNSHSLEIAHVINNICS